MSRPRLFALLATSIVFVLVVSISVWRSTGSATKKFTRLNVSNLDSRLRAGSDEGLQLFVFINFTQAASRQAFERLVDAQTTVFPGQPLSVHFLHFPDARCSTFEPPVSCHAAVAVECAEQLSPGDGLQYAASVYALQWEHKPTNLQHLLDLAEDHNYERGSFRACATRENKEIIARIDAHYNASSSAGLPQAPAVWMRWVEGDRVAFLGGTLDPRALRFAAQCLTNNTCGEDS